MSPYAARLSTGSASPRIKFCGLTRAEDARVAESLGAHYLGGIFAGGPRLLTVSQAKEVLGPRRSTVQRVGVFGAQSVATIVANAEAIDLDILQLHQLPSAADLDALASGTAATLWPVLRVTGASLPNEAEELGARFGTLVLDALVDGQLGGTGVQLNWSGLVPAVQALRRAVPAVQVVLAGGLRAQNVAEAIAVLLPDVVDVSSGVEWSPGVKDPARMQQFVAAAHGAAERA